MRELYAYVWPSSASRQIVLIILAIILAVGGAIAWRIISRRRAAAKIAEAMTETVAEDSDALVLKGRSSASSPCWRSPAAVAPEASDVVA